MGLKAILQQKKKAIVKDWIDLVIDTYPGDSSKFMKSKGDRFANPVGSTISQGLDALFDGLLNGDSREKMMDMLDPVVRIRAVQDFAPSQAVFFIIYLKKLIREKLKKETKKDKIADELAELEFKIDELSLLGFDVYMGCKETLFSIKANQEKTKIYKAFKRAGLVTEVEEIGPEPGELNI